MNVIDMPIAELAPAPYNPRKDLRPGDSEYESLKRSIQEFGVVDPVIFNTRTKRVVGGHQRLTVLRNLGHTTAPTVLVELDEVREKALNLALNKIAGAWDMPLLKDLLLDIERSGGDQTLTGFDPKEIEEIITSYRDDDPGEDSPVPEPPADPVTRTGDLYELGPHRLVCGDSRDGATWERLMGKEKAHCMWTDPPYGIDLQVRDSSRAAFHGKKGRDWTSGVDAFKGDKLADLAPLLRAVFPNADRYLRPGAPWYVAGPHGGVQHEIFIEAVLAAGWHHAQTLVWVKNAFVPGRHDYHSQHEAILYGWKLGAAHQWDRSAGDRATVIDDEPDPKTMSRDELIALVKQLRAERNTDVLREPKPRHNDLHPTMKPIPLIRRMLANSSWPEQIVLATNATRRKELAAHAVRSEAAAKIAAMITLAQSDAQVALRADDLDADPWLLNVANGTVDLRSGELRPHRREDLITKLAPVTYDPAARLELFDAFLSQTFGGDEDLISYVQKAAGYSLCGDTREEALFIAHGPTGGGKTTLAEALRAALGDYAATADPESFLTSRRDGAAPRADIARLHGRRLVVGVEVDQDRRMAEGLVKQLTGGDTVVARHLYREHFEFRPQFKLWIFANDAPRVRDDDDAVWRRLRLVPFVHPVPRERRDPQLKAALRDPKAGGPAVLAWAVAGCLLWQHEGLGVPPVIESATQSYREAQDPVADFVAESCVVEAGAWATVEELYGAYAAWAKAAGERHPLTKKGFAGRLERHGFPVARGAKGVRIRHGIALREQQRLMSPEEPRDNGILDDEQLPL